MKSPLSFREDPLFARLLVERGALSRRALRKIPDERDVPLHQYVVEARLVRAEEARRLRGVMMSLAVVCLDCERESILLRALTDDGIICPTCRGVAVLRHRPAEEARPLASLRGRYVRVALVTSALGVLALAVLLTPPPRRQLDTIRETIATGKALDPEPDFAAVNQAMKEFNYPEANHLLDEMLLEDGADVARIQQLKEILRGQQEETIREYEEYLPVARAYVEEAARQLEGFETRLADAEALLGEPSPAQQVPLEAALEFFAVYNFPRRNLGLDRLIEESDRGIEEVRRIRDDYIKKAAMLFARLRSLLGAPDGEEKPLYLERARQVLAVLPDLGVEQVALSREAAVADLSERLEEHYAEVDALVALVERLVEQELAVRAEKAVRRLPVPGLLDTQKDLDRIRRMALELRQDLIALVPGEEPSESRRADRGGARIGDVLWSVYEVTNWEYHHFVQETGYPPPRSRAWKDGTYLDGLADHPVTGVTYLDAVAFATWAGGRLPTEAEWRWAAQGGSEERTFPWGDDADPRSATLANFSERSEPRGAYARGASLHGIFDLAGNAAEIVLRSDGRPGHKGGGWDTGQWIQAARIRTEAFVLDEDETGDDLGFRVVYDPS